MNVLFYNVSKRENSTALPTGAGTNHACILKDGSNMITPTIALKWTGSAAPAYNYASIYAFGGRYYWITDWIFQDRQWIAKMRVDVLASFKYSIGIASKYILRSYSESNADAIDNYYPALSAYDENRLPGGFTNWGDYGIQGSGNFVITCIGDTNTTKGTGVAQYQLGATEVSAIIKNAYSSIDNEWNVAQDTIKSILLIPTRFFSDIAKYLTSVMWFPCSFPLDQTVQENIHLSFYNVTNAQYHPLSVPTVTDSYEISLAGIPGTGKKWEWLQPFTTYTLEAQPWGTIDLDGNDIVNSDKLIVYAKTDSLTGLSKLDVYVKTGNDPARLIATRTAQLGVAVPYGGSSPDVGGMIGGFVGVAASVVSAAQGNAGLTDIAASMGSAAAASAATGYASGTSGGGAAISKVHYLYIRRLHHADEDPAEVGYPLCKTKTINTLSGYVQCKDGDIADSIATEAELMQVKSYLEGGFFYE